MRKLRSSLVSAVSAGTLLTALAGAAPAIASEEAPGLYPEGNSVRIVAPEPPEKGTVTPQATLIWGETSFGANGSGAAQGSTIYTSFNTNVVASNSDTRVELSGTSATSWGGGTTPTNISLVDYIWANGLNVSVSIPPSATGSIGTSSVTYENSFPGESYGAHYYNGIVFTGLLTAVNQTTTATWTFGPQAYTVVAD